MKNVSAKSPHLGDSGGFSENLGGLKAVIVGDETIAAQNLKRLIEQVNRNIEIIAVLKSIKDISAWFDWKLSINLSIETPEKIIVSRVKAGEFKEWYTKVKRWLLLFGNQVMQFGIFFDFWRSDRPFFCRNNSKSYL